MSLMDNIPLDGTVQEIPQQSTPLCEKCSEIDFDAIDSFIRSEGLGQDGYVIRYLESLSPECALCAFFKSWLHRNGEHEAYKNRTRWRDTYSVRVLDGHRPHDNENFFEPLLAQKPCLRMRMTESGPGYSFPRDIESNVVMLKRASFEGLLAQSIANPKVNYERIKRLLRSCRDGKHEACTKNPSSPPDGLRVIDCKSNEVILLLKNTEYITLSYVWGLEEGTPTCESNKLPQKLPKVISDSIALSKSLGFRYLWIDRYCIPQHDEAQKMAQIQKMGDIYAASFLTIIAAAGDGPHHGLPGVGTTPREPPLVTTVGPYVLIYTDSPRKRIQSSKWATRGWTYQEGCMSTRRLVFTAEQAYFQCQSMHAFETTDLPSWPIVYQNPYGKLDENLFHQDQFSFAFPNQVDGSLVHSHIEFFFSRDLFFDEDALNALAAGYHVITFGTLLGDPHRSHTPPLLSIVVLGRMETKAFYGI
ncbi:uncharacterized protein PAC_08582 [Phialocephala subalpina]|uniref:Heterokaryon incompatibility domain-containing protein n=1 Tax=Phialocephala subalpina TaxID=576137 RepID=A0A1L7X111_9HELO|nr:uncharacterized protein PAC_08582 [Phialocephala subalpina]